MDKFIDNIDAFSTALPIDAAAIIMHMSLIPWPSNDVRDQFIKDLTNVDVSRQF
jgi:hypothetical protein